MRTQPFRQDTIVSPDLMDPAIDPNLWLPKIPPFMYGPRGGLYQTLPYGINRHWHRDPVTGSEIVSDRWTGRYIRPGTSLTKRVLAGPTLVVATDYTPPRRRPLLKNVTP